ncbi:hypothetical protein K5I29_06120 [Flavobacterium agricola]|uniref:DUF2892 family protein n=1 Tax=Flavobacterium agricola TaxID=2870839 RepID=A0ABY6M1R9_9FLAO|nr:hypothetical protein [Flavobacterium agricola]UYW02459.1 hypothetical protein K5I29_06120 [Flavobacterium agricola]
MRKWLQTWNIMRFLRLTMGFLIIYQGIELEQWLFAALGGLLVLMPLLNIGCCGTQACAVPNSKSEKNKKATFTEIK